MNKGFVFIILAVLALSGCQTKELDVRTWEPKHFTATIEDNFNGLETKTYLDENGNVRWKQGDQVSIFAGSTVNEQHQVTDASDGKTAAEFNKVGGSGFVGGTDFDNNVAFYPYASTAEIAKNGSAYVISDIALPATQNYAEASFGNGAFPMAAVTSNTDDMHLKFKNVLGGLKLQLKGTACIASISVTGNQNEVLCGAATVTVSTTSTPSISLTDASAKTVTLDCGEGVQLDTETATPFVIALPPMTMAGGFTVVVTDANGGTMEIKTTKTQTINRSSLLKMPVVDYVGVSSINDPLTFTSTGTTSITLSKVGSPETVTLEYRIKDGEWTEYSIGDAISLADGEDVSFRAGEGGNVTFSQSGSDYYKFIITGTGTVAASGNIMSLLGQNESFNIPGQYCFVNLFNNCTLLTTSPDLPATELADYCYANMFSNCRGLTISPALPAITLADHCYDQMFRGCDALIMAPAILPATTLANSCYVSMFHGCSSLVTAPALPATTLAKYCYNNMFYGCSKLTSAPALPATTLAPHCYEGMFNNCSELTTAPNLPATTLAESCYAVMFYACHGLTTAPSILPATSLAVKCYYGMFQFCNNLTTAPDLPATALDMDRCYNYMFDQCSSLNYVKALFTNTPGTYTFSWLNGVSTSGTFVKSKDATWNVTGTSGIPSGWTVLTE